MKRRKLKPPAEIISEERPHKVEPKKTLRSIRHLLWLFVTAMLASFHLLLETRIVYFQSCLEWSSPCGFLMIHMKRGNGLHCAEECVSLRKFYAMRSQGWTCGKCLKCFDSSEKLKQAVDSMIWDPVAAKVAYADMYGWPMGKWCFTPNVTNMSMLFASARRLEEFPLIDLSGWDTSHVTDMSRMFRLRSSVDNNITFWNVSNVRNMSQIFASVSVLQSNLSIWDTSRVTDMSDMFNFYVLGESNLIGDIGSWNVSNVRTMRSMFHYAQRFNSDISAWDTSRVTDMFAMFENAHHFNKDISPWNVSNVRNMRRLFFGATQFNTDVSKWDTSRVTDMSGVRNVSLAWDVSSVTDMQGMFSTAGRFNSDLSAWDTSSVTNMYSTFNHATRFNSDLSNWDTSRVTITRQMFYGAKAFNGDIRAWNISNVQDMLKMFEGAESFNRSLCDWESHMFTKSVHLNNVFRWTACPNQTPPDLFRSPPGPFCYNCDESQL